MSISSGWMITADWFNLRPFAKHASRANLSNRGTNGMPTLGSGDRQDCLTFSCSEGPSLSSDRSADAYVVYTHPAVLSALSCSSAPLPLPSQWVLPNPRRLVCVRTGRTHTIIIFFITTTRACSRS